MSSDCDIKQVPELWPHQKRALEKAGNKFALFFDPGLGKSRTAIELFKLKTLGVPTKVIILAPLNVCRNWITELKTYLGMNFEYMLVSGQTKPKKLEILKEFANKKLIDTSVFCICNTESIRNVEYRKELVRSGATFFIVDEAHYFKSPQSQQTKGLFNLNDTLRPKFVYLLTGTPAPQGEMDLWTYFTILGTNKESFFIWRKRHFTDKNERRRGAQNYWPEYVVTEKSKEIFRAMLDAVSIRAKKEKELELPPLLRTVLYAEMGKSQAKHYETMLEFLFAIDGEGHELNASNVLTRTLRLQQIIAGHLSDSKIIDNRRPSVLKDAITMTNREQFIVWTIFKATYQDVSEVLDEMGVAFSMLTGEQSAEERHEAINAFQAGNIRALIAHPKAGGVGINLTAASYSIHYTRGYSLTDDLQAEARNYRGGSERHDRITRIDIITPDTIDEEIVAALRSKKSIQDFILGLKEKHGRK